MRTSIKLHGQRGNLAFLLTIIVATRALFVIAIWWFSGRSGFIEEDSAGYVSLAQSLLRGSFGNSTPELLRTPGYPLLLAPAAALQHIVFFGLLENLLLAAAAAWFIWRIVIEFIGNTRVATWSVLLYCFEPVGLLYSVQIMSEMLFCLCMLLFVWLLLRYFRSPSLLSLLQPALALAAATYVRPVSLYLALWLTPVLLVFPGASEWRKRLSMAILFPAFFALALSPWVFRNAKVAGYTGFSSSGDFNLYFNSAAAVQARVQHKSFLQTRNELGFSHYYGVHPEQSSWTAGEIARFWRNDALRIISRHLSTYSLIHARGCAVAVFDTGGTVIASLVGIYPRAGGSLLVRILDEGVWSGTVWLIRSYPVAACLFLLLESALVLGYAVSIAGLRHLAREMQVLFVALTLYFVLVSGMPGATARYRVPFMPLLCITAGAMFSRRAGAKAARQGG